MPKPKKTLSAHTVVQHSAAGYKGDPTFAKGLETRCLESMDQVREVLEMGGVVFGMYSCAEKYAQREMFPPEVTGMVPRAPGQFSPYKVDGLCLYKP